MSSTESSTSTYYKDVAKSMIKRIETSYGKEWRKCFPENIQRELCAAQAFYLMRMSVDDNMPAIRLENHGHAAYAAAIHLLNLEE